LGGRWGGVPKETRIAVFVRRRVCGGGGGVDVGITLF